MLDINLDDLDHAQQHPFGQPQESLMGNFSLSPSAQDRLVYIFEQQQHVHKLLRIRMSGGGCAGYQQHFDLIDNINDDDYCFAIDPQDSDKGSVVIDPSSMVILDNAQLDYSNELSGAFFHITHPQAKSQCGCGTSFSF